VRHNGILQFTSEEGFIEHEAHIFSSFPCTDGIDYNDSLKNRKFENIIKYIKADQTYYYNQTKTVYHIDALQMLITDQRKYNYSIIIKD